MKLHTVSSMCIFLINLSFIGAENDQELRLRSMEKIMEGHKPGESYHLILKPDVEPIQNILLATKFDNDSIKSTTLRTILQEITAEGQKHFLPILENHAKNLEGHDLPFSYNALWIVNQIILTNPSPNLLKDLAKMDSVVELIKEIIFRIPEQDLTTQDQGDIQSTKSSAWHLDQLGAYQAWGLSKGSGITIAVMDTGCNYGHEQFAAGRITQCYSAINTSLSDCKTINDGNGHGTHCMGIVGGSCGDKSCGFAPECNMNMVQVLGSDGSGTSPWIMYGIQKIQSMEPHICSMSFGATQSIPGMESALKACVNTLMIAACGNSGCLGAASFPASYSGVVSVGAVGPDMKKADYSRCGFQANQNPSICGSGSKIKSAWIPDSSSYNTIDGTSMATPAVAGICALIWSKHPDMSAAQVKNHLLKTGTDYTTDSCFSFLVNGCCGGKIANAYNAVSTTPTL